MSKKYKNHVVAHSGRCSKREELCVSDDDDVCVVGEFSPKSSREYVPPIIALRSDSDSESKSHIGNTQTSGDKSDEKFIIDRNRQPIEDEFHAFQESSRVNDRHPPVPITVKRMKIRDESHIQQDVERMRVCPGLEHVTEIRGINETSYFCGICDRSFTEGKECIISHLKSSQHKLKSLKALQPEWYKILVTTHKKERKKFLCRMLGSIQKNEGIGKIVVERDSYADNYKTNRKLDTPSTSSDSASGVDCYASNILSDCSKANYFCRNCEVNMFDIELWESHSKKRLKNLRKYSMGKTPKIKIEKKPKSEAFLIDRVTIPNADPMVGLDFVREFQHIQARKETYHCLLCGDCLSCIDITQHLISFHHRKKYIERINHNSLDFVNGLNPKDNRTFYQLEEICRTIETDFGTGCPEVYVIEIIEIPGDKKDSTILMINTD